MRSTRSETGSLLSHQTLPSALLLYLANERLPVMQPSRTPRKQPQHLARAFSTAAYPPSASKPVNPKRHAPSSPPTSPPDSPRSAGGFSAFSDGDWEENLADNVKVTVRSAGWGFTYHSILGVLYLPNPQCKNDWQGNKPQALGGASVTLSSQCFVPANLLKQGLISCTKSQTCHCRPATQCAKQSPTFHHILS